MALPCLTMEIFMYLRPQVVSVVGVPSMMPACAEIDQVLSESVLCLETPAAQARRWVGACRIFLCLSTCENDRTMDRSKCWNERAAMPSSCKILPGGVHYC